MSYSPATELQSRADFEGRPFDVLDGYWRAGCPEGESARRLHLDGHRADKRSIADTADTRNGINDCIREMGREIPQPIVERAQKISPAV